MMRSTLIPYQLPMRHFSLMMISGYLLIYLVHHVNSIEYDPFLFKDVVAILDFLEVLGSLGAKVEFALLYLSLLEEAR